MRRFRKKLRKLIPMEGDQKVKFNYSLRIVLVITMLFMFLCDEHGGMSVRADEPVRMSNDPAKTEIFRDAGLGLFIHWGPNCQMGTEISWPLYNATKEYADKYYALADTFNPEHFDAGKWARMARMAGMEYVVFTSKHHDGFCMFDTKYSDLAACPSCGWVRDIGSE